MQILPCIDSQIISQKSPEEVADLLQSVTDSDKTSLCHFCKAFIGTVRPDSFKIVSNIDYRNSFLPVINGTIQADGTATKIDLQMRLSLFTRIFLYLWYSILVLPFFFLLLYNLLAKMEALFPLLVTTLFLAVPFLMARAWFYPPAQKALQQLNELLR